MGNLLKKKKNTPFKKLGRPAGSKNRGSKIIDGDFYPGPGEDFVPNFQPYPEKLVQVIKKKVLNKNVSLGEHKKQPCPTNKSGQTLVQSIKNNFSGLSKKEIRESFRVD